MTMNKWFSLTLGSALTMTSLALLPLAAQAEDEARQVNFVVPPWPGVTVKTEIVARLIDQDAWKRQATMEAAMGLHTLREESLATARRVIDGLHLDIISSRHSLDGHRHRYDLTGHFKEDA